MSKQKSGYTSTDGDPPHSHKWMTNELGNGQTEGLIGEGATHTHRIVQGKVQPAGLNQHTHKLIRKVKPKQKM